MAKTDKVAQNDTVDAIDKVRRGVAVADVDADEFRHPLRRIAFSNTEEVVEIYRGRFSWLSAVSMCISIVSAFTSLVFMALSFKNTAMELIAEEISYIDAQNPPWPLPPWGYVMQPDGAESRKIGQPFRFAMPQTTLFFSAFASSFGLFTVSYFCSEILVQDLGVARVKFMGDVINTGVQAYLFRTIPVIFVLTMLATLFLYFTSGSAFAISMIAGTILTLLCSSLGTNMNFEGGPRLTHALNYDLVSSLQLGIRTGAIAGLSAHSLATLGVGLFWIIFRSSRALLGFASGTAVIAFYSRVGGGIFSKGSDIGSDFVSTMIGEDVDDFNLDQVQELRRTVAMEDGDGEGDAETRFEQLQHARDPNAYVAEEELGYITASEAKLRKKIENEMEKTIQTMHPINYLDAIGENIADVGGTTADLFETMCMTLAISVNFGSKAHDIPYFGTSLPFSIISTGTLCCSAVSYWVWSHEKHSSEVLRYALRLNLAMVMICVQAAVAFLTFMHWKVWHTIQFDRMLYYNVIVFLGLLSPEACAYICEFFTSVNCSPVKSLARNASLGMIQVILQGLGQGFVSAGAPAIVNIVVQIIAYHLEGFYGLTLLACASQACTGWQATIAAYGAVANNAHRLVHLTTVNEIAHHRSNVCAVVGTTTSHNGKCVAGQCAFLATTSLLGALMAEKYTDAGKDFQKTVGQELSQWTRSGLLAGIIFTMLFLANTITGCIEMAKRLLTFCRGNTEVAARTDKAFPATHIAPLKTLVAFSAVESFKLTLAPMLQTACAPLVIGQLFGFKGLLMLVSGGNSVCFSLNMFLINSGQAWDAARKLVLTGMLKDESGRQVGAESEVYDTLGIGEQIGGPLEDLAGPALNNFIKLVSVVCFVTSDIYEELPTNTWPLGIVQIAVNFSMVSFLKFGLAWSINQVDRTLKRRQQAIDDEEGITMLREIEAREREVEARLAERIGADTADEAGVTY